MDKWVIKVTPGAIGRKEESDKAAVVQAVGRALEEGAINITVSRENGGRPTDHPPYGIIYDSFKRGKVVPFLGAGVSALARPDPALTWTIRSDFPPSGTELSRFLADMAGMSDSPDCEDLARVASYYVEVSIDPKQLSRTLGDIFSRASKPGDVHQLMAELPGPMLLVTTNYDTLTERAFQEAKHEYDVVVHSTIRDNMASVLVRKYGQDSPEAVATELLSKKVDPTSRTVIYKMHGSVDKMPEWNSFVITEEDYVDFLARMSLPPPVIPPLFTEYFDSRSFLFLGYGLRDWNLRVVLKNLNRVLPLKSNRPADQAVDFGEPDQQTVKDSARQTKEKKHWAVQRDPTPVESTLWDARGVRIFNVDLKSFANGLRNWIERET